MFKKDRPKGKVSRQFSVGNILARIIKGVSLLPSSVFGRRIKRSLVAALFLSPAIKIIMISFSYVLAAATPIITAYYFLDTSLWRISAVIYPFQIDVYLMMNILFNTWLVFFPLFGLYFIVRNEFLNDTKHVCSSCEIKKKINRKKKHFGIAKIS